MYYVKNQAAGKPAQQKSFQRLWSEALFWQGTTLPRGEDKRVVPYTFILTMELLQIKKRLQKRFLNIFRKRFWNVFRKRFCNVSKITLMSFDRITHTSEQSQRKSVECDRIVAKV